MSGMGNNFVGKLAGKTLYDFRTAIDYKIEGVDDRLKHLHSALEDDRFFKEYFDGANGYYNFAPNNGNVFDKKTALAEDINVCATLEAMGSYLIFEDSRQQKASEKREQREQRMWSLDLIKEKKDSDHIDFEPIQKKSRRNNTEATAYNKRIREVEQGMEDRIADIGYIKNLVDAIEKVNSKVLAYKEAAIIGAKVPFDSKTYYYYSRVLGELRDNLKLAKAAAWKVIEITPSGGKPVGINWDENEPDFMEVQHVKAFMQSYMELKDATQIDNQSDLKWIIYDFEVLVGQTELTERERRLYHHAIEEGFEDAKVAAEITHEFRVGYSRNNVARDLSAIAKKIAQQAFKNYENWYYTQVAKGTYKKCTECGSILLCTDTYYAKDSKGLHGVKSKCKGCISR